jgi:WD40 repeat protein
VWDTSNGKLVQNLEGPQGAVEWVRWHPKGNVVLAGSDDMSVWMWLAQTGACMQVGTWWLLSYHVMACHVGLDGAGADGRLHAGKTVVTNHPRHPPQTTTTTHLSGGTQLVSAWQNLVLLYIAPWVLKRG